MTWVDWLLVLELVAVGVVIVGRAFLEERRNPRCSAETGGRCRRSGSLHGRHLCRLSMGHADYYHACPCGTHWMWAREAPHEHQYEDER